MTGLSLFVIASMILLVGLTLLFEAVFYTEEQQL